MDEMKNVSNIAILMATFNGGDYLEEQIDSLLNQSYKDWTLYIHDDGSSDNTEEIIEKYASKYENIIQLKYNSTHGSKDNFFSLLNSVDANYYFFCDQDDVWHKDKIMLSLSKMKELEETNTDKPIIIHTDLFVVDSKLNIINDSFMHYTGIHTEFLNTFNECGAASFITGCTMLMNKKAKECIIYPANKATMHDAWITLCTIKANGIIFCIKKPLVYYRQHGSNLLGARSEKTNTLSYRICHLKYIYELNYKTYVMLKELGYGSIFKYIKYKMIYKHRIKNQNINKKTKE
jgi:glycosyltransferase involved in cell wall biosynthesis